MANGSGTKTNERPGTRASVRYLRVSAYKAREVLDLIRGQSYARASEILDFTDRAVAQVIKKVLDSAVANAEHNDSIPAEELYISACYADEGPTLKRFRPRARGRATRIRKRTCHITVIVSRLPEDKLERKKAKDASRPGSRAARVAGQQLEQEGRRRRRRNRKGPEGESQEHQHDGDQLPGAAEEAGIVDQQEPAVEQVDAVEAGEVDDDVVVETPAEAEGIVDPQEAAVEAAEDAADEDVK